MNIISILQSMVDTDDRKVNRDTGLVMLVLGALLSVCALAVATVRLFELMKVNDGLEVDHMLTILTCTTFAIFAAIAAVIGFEAMKSNRPDPPDGAGDAAGSQT